MPNPCRTPIFLDFPNRQIPYDEHEFSNPESSFFTTSSLTKHTTVQISNEDLSDMKTDSADE